MTLGLIITVLALGVALFIVLKHCKKTKNKLNAEIENKNRELSIKAEENFKLNSDLERFSGILSIENEIDLKSKEFSVIQANATELSDKFIHAKSIFKELEREIILYQNDLEFIELGIYEPVFNLDTSEKYKKSIIEIVTKQKELIKDNNACVCDTSWQIDGSYKQGEIMTRRNINLSLRAFNGECDSLISKVKWNNVKRFEERIKKSYEAVNKLGKSNQIRINDIYLKHKLDELHLTYELAHKKQQEKEEARAIREEQREEEKAQREYEKARKGAEMEEKRFQKALEKARKDLGLVSGEKLNELNSQILQLEQSLEKAHEAKERAISRAQETKSGHVYIISNLGSFGENVYKIGMTRRLEPMDRVKELGDASVPFTFDLHAMIFSENAPQLENLLHKEFDDRRINKVNYRKEYFKVTLDEIEQVILNKFEKEVDFIKDCEAQQYRETKSIIKQLQQSKIEQIEKEVEKYPDSLF